MLRELRKRETEETLEERKEMGACSQLSDQYGNLDELPVEFRTILVKGPVNVSRC